MSPRPQEIPAPPFQRGFSTNPDDDIFEFDPDYLDNRNPFDDTSDPDSEGKWIAVFNKTNINYLLCIDVFLERFKLC